MSSIFELGALINSIKPIIPIGFPTISTFENGIKSFKEWNNIFVFSKYLLINHGSIDLDNHWKIIITAKSWAVFKYNCIWKDT